MMADDLRYAVSGIVKERAGALGHFLRLRRPVSRGPQRSRQCVGGSGLEDGIPDTALAGFEARPRRRHRHDELPGNPLSG